jgi:hypothetical protein
MLNVTPRARRVALTVPIRYRTAGGAERWLEGRMLNVSESGVLFGPTRLEPGARLEVIFSAPVDIAPLGAGKVFCVGETVRITQSGAAAVRFEECRFLLER